MVAIQGRHPPFKGDSPHLHPQPSRTESSPTRSKVLPLRHEGWVPHVMQAGLGQKEPKPPRAERTTSQRLQALLHFRPDQRVKGRTAMQAACNRTRGHTLSTPTHPAWRPRPTRHVTDAPVTTCEKLHHHSRQYRASSTAEPVPRLEATLRLTRQCQPSALVTGQSAAGEGATVDTARNGPAVMVVAGGRKQQSCRQQAHAKTTRPCSVLRTALARTTAAPRTTRPVALTLRQDRRHLWQAKQATLQIRHNDRVKKARHIVRFCILFLFLFLSLAIGTGKGDTPKGILLREGSGPRAPLLIRGLKGWPLGRVQQPPQSIRAPCPLLVRGSKSGPSEGFNNRLRPLGLRAHY
jgi:hypothetical protein